MPGMEGFLDSENKIKTIKSIDKIDIKVIFRCTEVISNVMLFCFCVWVCVNFDRDTKKKVQ